MSSASFPVETYLKRIGLNSIPECTAEGLKQITRAQSFAISFENFDVLAQTPIRVDQESINNKILRNKRGGYCFELNGLLAAALEAAGFQLEKKLARVTYRRPAPGPKTHLVSIVKTENKSWLVDVGFGGPGLIEPVLFEADHEFLQNGTKFRLVDEGPTGIHLQRMTNGQWEGLYIVAPDQVLPIDIEVVNHFVSTWERSPFRSIFMCVTPRDSGLLTIQGTELLLLDENLNPTERLQIKDSRHLHEIVRSEFKIDAPAAVMDQAWRRVTA